MEEEGTLPNSYEASIVLIPKSDKKQHKEGKSQTNIPY